MPEKILKEDILTYLKADPDGIRPHLLSDIAKRSITFQVNGISCCYSEPALKKLYQEAIGKK